MSTIVYKDGVMGADTRAWAGNGMNIGTKKKVHRVKGGLLGISSSIVGMPERFLRTFERDGLTLCFDADWDIQCLFVNGKGQVFYFKEARCFTGPLIGEYFAIGSGERFALGAFGMGATILEALAVASKEDWATKAPFETLALLPIKPRKKKK